MKILVLLLLWILLVNIGFLLGYIDKNETLKLENRTLKLENRALKKQIYDIERLNSKLVSQNIVSQINLKGNNIIPKDTLKFIKIALKSTHPDNGGNSEDFIRCNEIYKILSKYKEQ